MKFKPHIAYSGRNKWSDLHDNETKITVKPTLRAASDERLYTSCHRIIEVWNLTVGNSIPNCLYLILKFNRTLCSMRGTSKFPTDAIQDIILGNISGEQAGCGKIRTFHTWKKGLYTEAICVRSFFFSSLRTNIPYDFYLLQSAVIFCAWGKILPCFQTM